ncbi:hypothetical protein FC81_GL000723 [Liquorilactobacillus capillatus DSM 19910]|uniref:MPN domain-containing protein n=1 Tax=Liquorilactobacillus capillatus DSM 19910 TaxID=1423731 RepID=A0A0R1M2X3_9LACO|nr:hypothetical protein FC81_GL000723 [Liquorilactobacillus capillatus DSM 19910]
MSNAPSIIVAHNHPSGDITPSKADISFTQELYKVCELLQIKLLEHLIIGFGGSYLSMKSKDIFGAASNE